MRPPAPQEAALQRPITRREFRQFISMIGADRRVAYLCVADRHGMPGPIVSVGVVAVARHAAAATTQMNGQCVERVMFYKWAPELGRQ